jgi:NAD(P)-dependent dehydrogenase (short-subunit alcohol dehydrogenase family)
MPAEKTSQPVVLITGCSEGGIGDYLARAFAARGCRVVATARNVASMGPLGALGCDLMPLDVTDPAACQATVEAVIAKYKEIHILVNNAGVPGAAGGLPACLRRGPGLQAPPQHTPPAPRAAPCTAGSLAEVPLDAFAATMDVNMTAPLRMIQLVGGGGEEPAAQRPPPAQRLPPRPS